MRFIAPSTRTSALRRKLQEGQAIVLIALLMLVLFAMLGLAIASGRAYVDRRDLQAAVDPSALAAGDWYENYGNLAGSTIPQSVTLFESDLRLYSGSTSSSCQAPCPKLVGPNTSLTEYTYVYTYPGNLKLTIVATNTQFNGYQFVFTAEHRLPLAFMQIFGGPTTAYITATATSIVGNQRQTPALLTLSTGSCATNLKGSAELTVLGDVYTNGTACVDSNLHEAGNCYGGAGSNCSVAQYWCYNSMPGFVPYAPHPGCDPGDTYGRAVVPAPTLPDPGYLAPSTGYYTLNQGYNQDNRGTWTEMYPGHYGTFHLSGGSASCAFLNGGVYTWPNGYQSDANGSLLSNELKAPDEQLATAPGRTNVANPQSRDMNGTNCAGHLTVTKTAVGQTVLLLPTCTDLSPVAPA